MTHRTLTILFLLALPACDALPPWHQWMEEGPPPGQEYTPLYVEGWQDGCHSGIHATANNWYKMHYSFRQDPYKAQDRVYYKGWKDAFDYCQRFMYQWKRRPYL